MTFPALAAFGLVMRNLLLVALVGLVCACGAYRFPGSVGTSGGGSVSGQVLVVPCGPAQPAGVSCSGSGLGGLEIDFVNGSDDKAALTGPDGTFSIALAPGTWKVRMKSYMRIVSGPSSVVVTPGSHLVANYVVDSGIRVPVPQQ